jgi:hypothetical protein
MLYPVTPAGGTDRIVSFEFRTNPSLSAPIVIVMGPGTRSVKKPVSSVIVAETKLSPELLKTTAWAIPSAENCS